jgi:hypothetical protein
LGWGGGGGGRRSYFGEMTKLAVEAILAAHPGVVDLRFDRSPRGAILHIHAVVQDERAAATLREAVARAVGGRFADDRLEIVVEKAEAPAEAAESTPPEPTVPPAELPVAPSVFDEPADSMKRSPETKPLDLPAGRIRLIQVASNVRPGRTSIEVSLERNGDQATESSEGPSYSGSSINLAGVATLQAVGELLPTLEGRVDHASSASISGERVVLVALSIKMRAESHWKRLHGISGIGEGTPEAAAARAVLSALNRIAEPR